MHHYRIDADQIEQDDILREGLREFGGAHRMATVLDDESLAAKAPYIGKRFGQNLRSIVDVLHFFKSPRCRRRPYKRRRCKSCSGRTRGTASRRRLLPDAHSARVGCCSEIVPWPAPDGRGRIALPASASCESQSARD